MSFNEQHTHTQRQTSIHGRESCQTGPGSWQAIALSPSSHCEHNTFQTAFQSISPSISRSLSLSISLACYQLPHLDNVRRAALYRCKPVSEPPCKVSLPHRQDRLCPPGIVDRSAPLCSCWLYRPDPGLTSPRSGCLHWSRH